MDSIICYVSLVKKRFPILVLDHKISKKFLKNIIKLYKPENICCSIKNNFFTISKDFVINFEFRNFQFLKNINKDNFKVKNNLSILATTSGTTGSFKLIRQTYDNITSNTFSIIKYLKLNKNNITITNLPLSYTFGMSVINTHLEVGSKIAVTSNTIFEKEFWKLFRINQINTIYGVPYTYEILDKLNFFSKNTSSVKMFAQAGGKMTENLQKKISFYVNKYKKIFFIMYGQAEATTRISYLPSKKFSKKIGSIGIPIPGGKIKLVDKNNLVIKKPNIAGEILYSGKNVCMGYAYDRYDLNCKNQWNGKIYTGDLARRDSDGFYYIVGRKKRFAKIYGLSINLDDIENILKSKFQHSNFAVISLKNKIKIFSSTRDIKNKILNYLNRNLNIPSTCFIYNFIKKIPKSKNGKNNYKILSNYS
tara:strand:- start:77 stop:1339 length:1263 start_codon:yes stop_codon:yes gene_type:complete